MPLNASFVRLLKNKVSSEQPKIIIHQKWGTNNLNACLCPKSNLAHRRKVKRRSRYRHPPLILKGAVFNQPFLDFTKKRNAFIQKNLKKGYPQKEENLPAEYLTLKLDEKQSSPKSYLHLT